MYDGLVVSGRPGSARLPARDLAILGRYLFGARWKAALARELKLSDRILKYWASGQRPTSVRCSALIIALVQRRRADRLRQVQQGYAAMVSAMGVPVAALAITAEVVPPYLVPGHSLPPPRIQPAPLFKPGAGSGSQPGAGATGALTTSLEKLLARYEQLGFVAMAEALRAA